MTAREQECGRVGPFCRQRVADETARRAELAKAIADRAVTEQAARLDRDADAQPVESINPHGAALARLLRLPDTSTLTASTWQQFAVAVIIELLIAVSLVAIELLREEKSAPELRANAELINPPPSASASLPAVVRQPATRLVRERTREIDADPIIAFLKQRVPHAPGEQADWAMIYGHFIPWCDEQKPRIEPYPSGDFGAALAFICKEAGTRMRRRGGRVYCLDRKVVPNVAV